MDDASNTAERVLPTHLRRHAIWNNCTFRKGLGPYPITDPSPSLRTCLRHFGSYEYGIIGISFFMPVVMAQFGGGNEIIRSIDLMVDDRCPLESNAKVAGYVCGNGLLHHGRTWLRFLSLLWYPFLLHIDGLARLIGLMPYDTHAFLDSLKPQALQDKQIE